ncbi:MAG: OmpA family protein [Cytophagales bacterium]|nr:OmpA family protein [Cytophagales bacterium]
MHINSNCTEPSVSVTADGQTLYFSSTKPDIYGDLDIFVSHKKKNGKWGKSTRLGPEINTEYDEDAPFILPDGKTLYFSSRGHKGMGDYDVFRTILDENGKWSEPENIGYPVNTAENDIYFVFSNDGKRGYFSSYRKEGYGEQDIYVVNLPDLFALFQRFDNDSLALIAMIRSYGVESNRLTNEIVLNDILGAEKAKKMAQYLEIKRLTQSEARELEKEFLQKDSTEVLALVVLEEEGKIIVMEEEEFMPAFDPQDTTATIKDTSVVKSITITTDSIAEQFNAGFMFSCYYRLRIVDKSKITVEGGYIVDGITIGYYDQVGAFNFVKLSPDELRRLSAPVGSMLTADRELVVNDITIGYYSEDGEFHYSNLSPDEIRRLSSRKGPVLTADRKLMFEGVTIAYYDVDGKFQFVNLSPDEIKRLSSPEGTMLTADRKYVVDNVAIGHYDKKGTFKFAKLSSDEIRKLTPPPKSSLLTADRKLVVYGITLGYYNEQGEFNVSNLSADELDELSSIVAVSRNQVDEITVGCYDDQGEFKYVVLSPDEIRWLTSVAGAMITADGKYVVDGVTIGYSASSQPPGGDSIPPPDSLYGPSLSPAPPDPPDQRYGTGLKGERPSNDLTVIELHETKDSAETEIVSVSSESPEGDPDDFSGKSIACAEVGKSIKFKNILFNFDNYALRSAAFKGLNYLKDVIEPCDEVKITIIGHTDNVGPASYNQALSEKRAKSVYDQLIKKGVQSSKLTYKGYGEEKPVVPNDTKEKRQLNRRVEFEILN